MTKIEVEAILKRELIKRDHKTLQEDTEKILLCQLVLDLLDEEATK